MIHLHLAIYDGDVEVIDFDTIPKLCEYLQELKSFDCIWLATDDGEKDEIVITENLQVLIGCVYNGHFSSLGYVNKNFFVQEYQTYEDAYKVALDMREGNPKCYNNDR